MCRQTWRYVEQGAKGAVNFAGLVAVTYPGASLASGQGQCQTQESQQRHRHTHSLRHFHSRREEVALCSLESQATKFYQLYFSTKLIQGESMKLSILRLRTKALQSSCHITPVWRKTDFWACPAKRVNWINTWISGQRGKVQGKINRDIKLEGSFPALAVSNLNPAHKPKTFPKLTLKRYLRAAALKSVPPLKWKALHSHAWWDHTSKYF